ncbi:MAG: lysylphosphatidylglycerol synthase transmembrane domain-containing protein [Longimicrobiales bacterium]|nr:lysylphosphatidylglycerol synthase transmembrane domain-containing protein [Longimicrobiales bacterium]
MTTSPRRDRGRRALRLAVQIVLTGTVTWFIVDRVGVDLSRLARLDVGAWELRWQWIALSVVTLTAGYILSAALWGRMVVELGGARIPPARAVRIFLVANLGRYVPGKVLQLAGLTVLAAREGVRPATAAVSAVLGQGVALLGATLIGLAAFFAPGSGMRVWGWFGLATVVIFLVLGSLPAARRILHALWARFAKRDPQVPPPVALADPTFVWRWTAYYALNWALYATAFWLLFIGVVGWTPFLEAGPAFAAAYVGGYIALFAPAGLGIRESLLTVFLTPLVTPERALALAVIARLWTTLVEVVPALALAPRTLRGLAEVRAAPPETAP